MSVTVTRVDSYRDFGACLHVTNGIIEAFATIDQGPRIIHFGLTGGKNLFWTDDDGQSVFVKPGLDKLFGRGDKYYILGGHRLWASPEDPTRTYYPDTAPVAYTITPSGCVLNAAPQHELGLQMSIELKMSADSPEISVRHRIQYGGSEPLTLAPWAITQMAPGGIMAFPQSKLDLELLPDRVFVIWPYTDMSDKRLTWADDYIALRHDAAMSRPLKIGTHNRHGSAIYSNDGVVFKKIWNVIPNAVYPDYGCSFESYTNRLFLEFETLAPLVTLEPNQSATHEEIWSCCEDSETDIVKLLDKYCR